MTSPHIGYLHLNGGEVSTLRCIRDGQGEFSSTLESFLSNLCVLRKAEKCGEGKITTNKLVGVDLIPRGTHDTRFPWIVLFFKGAGGFNGLCDRNHVAVLTLDVVLGVHRVFPLIIGSFYMKIGDRVEDMVAVGTEC